MIWESPQSSLCFGHEVPSDLQEIPPEPPEESNRPVPSSCAVYSKCVEPFGWRIVKLGRVLGDVMHWRCFGASLHGCSFGSLFGAIRVVERKEGSFKWDFPAATMVSMVPCRASYVRYVRGPLTFTLGTGQSTELTSS